MSQIPSAAAPRLSPDTRPSENTLGRLELRCGELPRRGSAQQGSETGLLRVWCGGGLAEAEDPGELGAQSPELTGAVGARARG